MSTATGTAHHPPTSETVTSHPATVRSLAPDELDALVQLCAEHAAFERSPFRRTGQADRLRTLVFGSDKLWVWVVEVAGELEGFASGSLEVSTWRAEEYFHLDCLFLRPSLRGRGLGSRLLRTVAEQARRLGCREMQWQTPPWNTPAIAFYEAHGARALSKQRFSWEL